MVRVVGVRFRTAGKIYFFDPLEFTIRRGENVIVETARGIEFGTVVSDIREVDESAVVQPLKPILRIANQRDQDQEAGNKEKEKEAFKICQEKIRKHGLEMKLIDAEYTFDNNKVLFYFTADGRIDFRELVKDLAGVFKTRIELRQIGVRDETKIMGGIGICGRPLCCHSYLSDFIAVSIKMAKEQNLSLNPTKISGVCGRLMCCLKNEEETYEELNSRLPNVGDYVTTPEGQRGEVHSVNVLRQLVKVLVEAGDDKELKEFEVDQLKFHKHHGKKGQQNISPEELKELEKLEKEEEEEIEAAEQSEKEAGTLKESRQGGRGGDRRGRQDRGDRQENKGERQGKNNRQGDKQQGGERRENNEKNAGHGERQGRNDGQGRQGKRQDKWDKNRKNEGADEAAQGERQGERQGGERKPRREFDRKPGRQNRQGGQDGQERQNRQDGQERQGRNDGQERQERQGRQGRQDGNGNQESSGRQNRNRGNRPFRDRNRNRENQEGPKE
ncbi:MAG: hypothetical protein J6Z22_09275 [Lachnospiraceae bacterium]|nr:hypothetical protein [Lachnospiraceae bacterium]